MKRERLECGPERCRAAQRPFHHHHSRSPPQPSPRPLTCSALSTLSQALGHTRLISAVPATRSVFGWPWLLRLHLKHLLLRPGEVRDTTSLGKGIASPRIAVMLRIVIASTPGPKGPKRLSSPASVPCGSSYSLPAHQPGYLFAPADALAPSLYVRLLSLLTFFRPSSFFLRRRAAGLRFL